MWVIATTQTRKGYRAALLGLLLIGNINRTYACPPPIILSLMRCEAKACESPARPLPFVAGQFAVIQLLWFLVPAWIRVPCLVPSVHGPRERHWQ